MCGGYKRLVLGAVELLDPYAAENFGNAFAVEAIPLAWGGCFGRQGGVINEPLPLQVPFPRSVELTLLRLERIRLDSWARQPHCELG